MNLITLKCKVKLFTEEEIELLDEGLDLPNVKGSWLIRDKLFRASEIYDITRHSSGKTLLTTYDGDHILVMEPFLAVCAKWKAAEDFQILSLEENDSEEVEES